MKKELSFTIENLDRNHNKNQYNVHLRVVYYYNSNISNKWIISQSKNFFKFSKLTLFKMYATQKCFFIWNWMIKILKFLNHRDFCIDIIKCLHAIKFYWKFENSFIIWINGPSSDLKKYNILLGVLVFSFQWFQKNEFSK